MLKLATFLGIDANHTSHREKWVAATGAMLAIAAVFSLSQWALDDRGAVFMLASMGASAVLLFAVPHGTLSQPWALIGGHLLSALIGVTCYRLVANPLLAAALAVGVAVGAMSYLRCVHPPGGATALAAVIGGPAIQQLGYGFVLFPLALNVLLIFVVALAFNNLFPWRRYPVALMRKARSPSARPTVNLSHEDFAAAMLELDTYIDVSSEELSALFEKASAHARRSQAPGISVRGGACYSNGAAGADWAVRQVLDLSPRPRGAKAQLIYKNVAGPDLYETGICRLSEFQHWAAFEVEYCGRRWIKAPGSTAA